MANQSSAYDFALFEPKRSPEEEPQRQPAVIELPKERLEQNRRPKLRPWRIVSMFLVFLAVSGMLGLYIYGQAQLGELSASMGAAEETLREEQNQYSRLKIKSDTALSMETVESYAAQKLGMKKTTEDQVTTVELSKGDKSEVVSGSSQTGWLDKALEAVREFLS
jgi:cell division protein FtsL